MPAPGVGPHAVGPYGRRVLRSTWPGIAPCGPPGIIRLREADAEMSSFGIEMRCIPRLSLPVALSQLGMTTMAAIDTILLGHVGVDELAACALGNVWEWTWLCLGFGLV